jgi:hypothetical protein
MRVAKSIAARRFSNSRLLIDAGRLVERMWTNQIVSRFEDERATTD